LATVTYATNNEDLMVSERIPCGLSTVTSPPKGQGREYDKKYFLSYYSTGFTPVQNKVLNGHK
jgi:hypothetical protein